MKEVKNILGDLCGGRGYIEWLIANFSLEEVVMLYNEIGRDMPKRVDENTIIFLGKKYKKYPSHTNKAFRKFYKQTRTQEFLHRKIFEHHHKRDLRIDELIEFIDNNPENLSVSNLIAYRRIKRKG